MHSVYSLIECPPLPKATYVLVKREQGGRRRVLHVGLGQSEAATLNLAGVRQRGAQLGANEVHVHFAAAFRCSAHSGALRSPRRPVGQPGFRARACQRLARARKSFSLAFQLQPIEKPPPLVLAGTSLHRRTLQP